MLRLSPRTASLLVHQFIAFTPSIPPLAPACFRREQDVLYCSGRDEKRWGGEQVEVTWSESESQETEKGIQRATKQRHTRGQVEWQRRRGKRRNRQGEWARWAGAYGVSADVVACEDSTVTYVPVRDIKASPTRAPPDWPGPRTRLQHLPHFRPGNHVCGISAGYAAWRLILRAQLS